MAKLNLLETFYNGNKIGKCTLLPICDFLEWLSCRAASSLCNLSADSLFCTSRNISRIHPRDLVHPVMFRHPYRSGKHHPLIQNLCSVVGSSSITTWNLFSLTIPRSSGTSGTLVIRGRSCTSQEPVLELVLNFLTLLLLRVLLHLTHQFPPSPSPPGKK